MAGEERGLLGSLYLARHLPLPAGRIAANINVDGANIWGRTRDVGVVGLGKSSLDSFIREIAAWQGRTVVPEAFPDHGTFYRSDQFSFAGIGIPAAYLDAGTDVIGRPAGWGREQQLAFEEKHYHQPSDELRARLEHGRLGGGRPPPLLARRPDRQCAGDAGVEPGRRVRGGPEEVAGGAGREVAPPPPQASSASCRSSSAFLQ